MKLEPSVLCHGVAGVGAGLAATMVLYPLEVVKIRLHVQGTLQAGRFAYRNTFHAISTMLKTESWRALYLGLQPALAASGMSWGVYMLTYNASKKLLSGNRDVGKEGQHTSTGVNVGAAFIAGLATLATTNPLYVVKTRLSLRLLRRDPAQPLAPLPSTLSMLRQILREEGLPGWYRGAIPSIFAIPQGTLQFAAYEWLKENLPRTFFHPPGAPLSPLEFFVAGAASKVFASGFLYPYQVVRSRIVDERAPTTSAWRALVLLLKHDGPRALYRGLGAQLLRVTPHSAIALLVYEMIMKQARLLFPSA